jgi:integrase
VKKVRGRLFRRTFQSLEEAVAFQEALERRLAKSRRPETTDAAPITVGDLVERWYTGHRKRLQPGTQFDYEWRIRHDISKIADIDALDLIRDRSILHDFYWNKLGPQSARNARTILHQAFEEATIRKLIPENPAKGQKLPPARLADKDIPTIEEVTKMILAAEEEDARWGLFVKITATLGTRRGETCALRWEDFDRAGQRVLIRLAACVSRDVLTIKAPKSGRSAPSTSPPRDSGAVSRKSVSLTDSCSVAGSAIRSVGPSLDAAPRTSAGTSTVRAVASAG